VICKRFEQKREERERVDEKSDGFKSRARTTSPAAAAEGDVVGLGDPRTSPHLPPKGISNFD